jgi:hypothetical protein
MSIEVREDTSRTLDHLLCELSHVERGNGSQALIAALVQDYKQDVIQGVFDDAILGSASMRSN